MNREPFTDWVQVPLTCDIATTARVLDRSVSSIEQDLADDCMQPAPMPDVGAIRRGQKKHRRQWSKDALMAWHGGGYLAFEQDARRSQRKGKKRHFFGKAAGRLAAAS